MTSNEGRRTTTASTDPDPKHSTAVRQSLAFVVVDFNDFQRVITSKGGVPRLMWWCCSVLFFPPLSDMVACRE